MNIFSNFPDSFPKEEFQKVRDYLNGIPNIGFGGCGVSALAMYRWLENWGYNMNNVRFVMGYSRGSENTHRNLQAYANENKLVSSCTHMGLIIQDQDRDITFDAMMRWYFDDYEHAHVISQQRVMGAINGTNWNFAFDREKHIPEISRELGVDLSDVRTVGHVTD